MITTLGTEGELFPFQMDGYHGVGEERDGDS